MFSKRSFLFLTVGISLSLSACAGEPDSDFDLDGDAPAKKPMDGSQGYNGGPPSVVGPCLKGIAAAAHRSAGADSTGWLEDGLGSITCTGGTASGSYDPATDGPDYLNRPITVIPPGQQHNEVIHNMVWSGVAEGESIKVFNATGTKPVFDTFVGEGFIDANWKTDAITDQATLSTFIAVNVAKLNPYPTPVPVFLDGDTIVGNEAQGDYTVLESVIAAHYQVVNGIAFGEVHVFKVLEAVPAECNNPSAYYAQRLCVDPVTGESCLDGAEAHAESEMDDYCVDADKQPASGADAVECFGWPVVRVWVQEGALAAVPGSACAI